MGMQVMGIKRDLLVNAWYTGGVDVIDFSQPTRLKEIATTTRGELRAPGPAYPYTGPMFKTGPGIPVYASDGVTNNGLAQGMVVYRTIVEKPGVPKAGRPPEPADDGPRNAARKRGGGQGLAAAPSVVPRRRRPSGWGFDKRPSGWAGLPGSDGGRWDALRGRHRGGRVIQPVAYRPVGSRRCISKSPLMSVVS